MTFHHDRWLTDTIGHDVFRIDAATSDSLSEIAEGTRRHAREQRAAMYFTRLDTSGIAAVRAFAQAGLYVVDVSLTFRLSGDRMQDTADAAADRPGPGVDVRAVSVAEAQKEHPGAVLEMGASCFRFSRFHLDPLLEPGVADHVKREWVRSYLRGTRGDRLFTATLHGRPVGFLAALTSQSDGHPTAVIDLIGVDASVQRQRVGATLARSFIQTYRGDVEFLDVTTQGANVPSIRLYEALGFRLIRSQYVMHMHVRDGQARAAAGP